MRKSPWRQIRAPSNAADSPDTAKPGINRVSLGAQSFGRRALERLGRIHSADDTHRAVAELRAAKLDNFNLDLMYALPGQSLEEALEDVRIACELGPAHISYYQLTLEPGTVFHARPPQLPDEDAAWQMQTAGQKLLAEAGFDQYEVSAYARHWEALPAQHELLAVRRLFGSGRRRARKTQSCAPAAHPAHHQTQAAPRISGADADADAGRPAGQERPIGESSFIAAADLPFEFMLNALRLNEGFTVARLSAANRS